MSMVNAESLAEFKLLYKKEYGIELDDKAALFKAEGLLALMRAVYKPIPKVDSNYVYGYGNKQKKAKTTK